MEEIAKNLPSLVCCDFKKNQLLVEASLEYVLAWQKELLNVDHIANGISESVFQQLKDCCSVWINTMNDLYVRYYPAISKTQVGKKMALSYNAAEIKQLAFFYKNQLEDFGSDEWIKSDKNVFLYKFLYKDPSMEGFHGFTSFGATVFWSFLKGLEVSFKKGILCLAEVHENSDCSVKYGFDANMFKDIQKRKFEYEGEVQLVMTIEKSEEK